MRGCYPISRVLKREIPAAVGRSISFKISYSRARQDEGKTFPREGALFPLILFLSCMYIKYSRHDGRYRRARAKEKMEGEAEK
jgi:hypothetical protein